MPGILIKTNRHEEALSRSPEARRVSGIQRNMLRSALDQRPLSLGPGSPLRCGRGRAMRTFSEPGGQRKGIRDPAQYVAKRLRPRPLSLGPGSPLRCGRGRGMRTPEPTALFRKYGTKLRFETLSGFCTNKRQALALRAETAPALRSTRVYKV